jgi:hypothetical protein
VVVSRGWDFRWWLGLAAADTVEGGVMSLEMWEDTNNGKLLIGPLCCICDHRGSNADRSSQQVNRKGQVPYPLSFLCLPVSL